MPRWRTGSWVTLAAVLLIVASLAALYWLTVISNPPPAVPAQPLARGAIRDFETRVRSRLGPVPVRFVRTVRVHADSVVLKDGSAGRLLSVPSLVFSLRLDRVPRGEVLAYDGVIQGPEVRLVRGAGGKWNYQSVLEPLLKSQPSKKAGTGMTVTLRDFVVRDGMFTLRLPSGEYGASALRASIPLAELAGPKLAHPQIELASAEAMVTLPGTAGGTVERQVALTDASLELPGNGLQFRIARIRFGTSTFADATGLWSPKLGGLGLRAQLQVTDLRLADLPWLKTNVPPSAHASGRVVIRPVGLRSTDIAVTRLDLTAPGSHVLGSLQLVLGPGGPTLESVDLRVEPLQLSLVEAFTGPLPYSGELRGRIHGTGQQIAFELQARLATTTPTRQPFAARLTGIVSTAERKVQIRELTVHLQQVPLSVIRQFAPGLPLAGPVSGTIRFQGAPGQVPLQIDIRLEAGGGVITVAGTIELQKKPPSYDLHGRIVGVELRRVLAAGAPPARVNATFRLVGSGFRPATATAAVTVNGTFTGWESQPGDTVAIVARVDNGLLQARSMLVDLGPIHLTASGNWRFADSLGGALDYDLTVASLEPLAPYFPSDTAKTRPFIAGSISTQGTLTGTLHYPALAGTVTARDFRYGEWAVGQLQGRYRVRRTTGLPVFVLDLTGTDLRTPSGDFDRVTLTADFTPPTFALALDAHRVGGGVVQVEASGHEQPGGAREVLIRKVELDLRGQRWRLPQPAQIAWQQGQVVRVNDLRLVQVGGTGMVSFDGIVAPPDLTDFTVQVNQLPVGEVLALAGSKLPVQGLLELRATVRGPADSPAASIQIRLVQGAIRGVPLRELTGQLGYGAGRITLDATGLLGDSAQIQMTAAAGAEVALGFPPSFHLVRTAPVEAHVVTQRFPLSTLDPGFTSITDITGDLSADMRLAGTPDAPQLSGSVAIQNGAATVPTLDKRYHDMNGRAILSGRTMTLQDVSITSSGTAVVSGQITFKNLTNPTLDIAVQLNGFEPQGVSGVKSAEAMGTLTVTGSLTRPTLSGNVRLNNGYVSLIPVEQAGFGQRPVGAGEGLDLLQPNLPLAQPTVARFTVRDLEVTAGDNLWFLLKEARVQLAGTLTINRTAGEFSIEGTLSGTRGTFTLTVGPGLTRQFTLVSATVRFFGTPSPNPALDITASRVVLTGPTSSVDVRIHVTGTISNPSVTLASAAGVALPESELLCFLAVGRSCAELSNVTGQSLLGQAAALYGLTDLVSATIAPELGLDYFEIQMRPGAGFDQLFLIAGKELPTLPNVFVNVETPLTGNNIAAYSAVSLEWRFKPTGTLQVGYAPPEAIRYAVTGRPIPTEYVPYSRQLFIATRWHWTY